MGLISDAMSAVQVQPGSQIRGNALTLAPAGNDVSQSVSYSASCATRAAPSPATTGA